MDIKIWEGGLQPQEIRAVEGIQQAFKKPTVAVTQNKAVRGRSFQYQLRNIGGSSMFPWKGYAGNYRILCERLVHHLSNLFTSQN